MKYRNLSIWKNIDKPLLVMYLLLSIIGYFIMYSSTFKGFNLDDDFWSSSYGKQLICILVTFFMGCFILLLDGSFIKNYNYLDYKIDTIYQTNSYDKIIQCQEGIIGILKGNSEANSIFISK